MTEAKALIVDDEEFVVIETLLDDEESDEIVPLLDEVMDALEEPDEIMPVLEPGVIVAVALAGMLLKDDIRELISLLILLELDMELDIVLDMLLLEDDEVIFLGGRLWFAGGKHWVHS